MALGRRTGHRTAPLRDAHFRLMRPACLSPFRPASFVRGSDDGVVTFGAKDSSKNGRTELLRTDRLQDVSCPKLFRFFVERGIYDARRHDRGQWRVR
jgi:hypothetical protein